MRGCNLQDAKFMAELEKQSFHTSIIFGTQVKMSSNQLNCSLIRGTKQNSLAPLYRKRSKRKPVKKLYH